VQNKIRKQIGHTLSKHGLADSWRAMEEHVMPTRSGYLAGPLCCGLPTTSARSRRWFACFCGALTYYLDGVYFGIGTPCRKATSWSIEAIPKTSMPSTSFASPHWRKGTLTLVKPAC
jgi:hypothetical protein